MVLLTGLATESKAQLSTASLQGVVHDPTGAVVPGATITLRNIDTAVQNATTANSAGSYTFVSITPGQYALTIMANGFSQQQVPPFTLTVGQAATFDFTLTIGTQASIVTVQGSAPLLEVSSANLGTVIETKQVNDLPLNGRNFTQLLTLTPGASSTNTSQSSGGYATPVAVGSSFSFPAFNGQSNRSNYFLTDGLSNFGSFQSTYAVAPIIDAIQEFKVVSHTDSAQYGSVLGGIVNVVTKSGTNDLHGSAFEFARNAVFDARTYFLPQSVAKTPFSQNQFGGSIGGPVLIPKLYNGRNKTFFFGAYQGFRYNQTSNSPYKVPTAAQLSGDESDWPTQIFNPFSTRPDPAHPGQYIRDPFPGNQIPKSMIDQRMIAYAGFVFPAAGPVIDSGGDNGLDTTPLTQTLNEWSIRIDETIGKSDSAWFRYSSASSVQSGSGGLPGIPEVNTVPNVNWGGSYVHVFSPSLVLQLQFGRTVANVSQVGRFNKSTASIISQAGFSSAFTGNFTATANGGSLLPGPGISNFSNASENVQLHPAVPAAFQFSGDVTKTIGRHELHFGGGYTSNKFESPVSTPGLGFASQQTGDPENTANAGDPLASFILNVPDNASRRNVNETTRPGGVLSAYAQDNWRTTTNLTLNFGLRYDVTLIPPYGTDATIGQQGGIETGDMDFSNGTYVLQKLPPSCNSRGFAPCIPGDGTLPAHVVVDPRGKIAHNIYSNVGPRFGFAYRLGDKTVVKGAFGILYDNWSAVLQMAQNIEGSWPDIGQQNVANLNQPSSVSAVPTVQAQNPLGNNPNSLLPGATPFTQVGFFYDPHIKNPYADQWNFGIQRQLSGSTTVTMNYVGSTTHRLDEGGFYNTARTPGPGDPQARSPYPYIAPTYYDRSFGNTGSYNAMQLSLDKRFTSGLSYQVAYTWSKAMNCGTDGYFGVEGGVPQDPYNPCSNGDHSVAGFDLTNILSINTLYQIPVGKGRSYSTGNGALDYVLGNWQLNNIFQAHSGQPFTPSVSGDIANTGNSGYEHADRIGDPNANAKRTPAQWFNTAAYAVPQAFTFGTAGRNSLRAPGFWQLDTSVFRQFPIGRGRQFEFRAEAFNLLNNVIYGTPNNNLTSGTAFGTITGTANTARQLQLALKFSF